jgi:hypothetical protein
MGFNSGLKELIFQLSHVVFNHSLSYSFIFHPSDTPQWNA